MRVVDTCAGAGGKTLHMAALMEKQDYIAMDLYESKLKQLKIRKRRSLISNTALSTLQK
jgi:16S rRNA (cytosine967-C5)-methyltransferase